MSNSIPIESGYQCTETSAETRAGHRYGINLLEPPSDGTHRRLAIQQRRELGG